MGACLRTRCMLGALTALYATLEDPLSFPFGIERRELERTGGERCRTGNVSPEFDGCSECHDPGTLEELCAHFGGEIVKKADVTLYLVTNREGMEEAEFLHRVEGALKGGVTLLQLREKEAEGREFILWREGERLDEGLRGSLADRRQDGYRLGRRCGRSACGAEIFRGSGASATWAE